MKRFPRYRPKVAPRGTPTPTREGRKPMWRTSVSAEHVRLFFAVDAALRHASDEHAPVRARLAELRAAMDGTPGASIAAAAALKEACTEAGVVPTPLASVPGQSPSRPNEQDAQEVVPGLWLAPVFPVETRSWLESARITHVVDATGGWRRVVSALENSWERKRPCFPELAEYLVLDAEDKPSFPLDDFFERSTAFIEEALRAPGAAVVVHCHSGVSRSTTLVMAYLMSRHGIGLQEALRVVRDARPCVRPNEGFERQLARHEMKLRVAARAGKRAREEEQAREQASERGGAAAAQCDVAGPAAAVGGAGTSAVTSSSSTCTTTTAAATGGGGGGGGGGVGGGGGGGGGGSCGGGGSGAALDAAEEEAIRSLPTEAALSRLCGHMGAVGKFTQVAALLEARLRSDLTPQTAAAYHEALRKAIGNGRGPKVTKLRPAYASLFGAALARLEDFEDAQADDVAVWAFGAVGALQLTKPQHPLTPESFEPAALQVELLLRRLLDEKAAGRAGAGGTLREAIVGGALFSTLEAMHAMLRHEYTRARACGALRLAVQLGGACFSKEQRAKLASWNSRAQNFS